MPNTEFEMKLHQLVYPEVAAKAPRLIKNMVAFELLDVDDDETVAQAVYAFRVGEQLVYVPIFYANGHVEGLNLMYLENEDLFIPLQESWIDYLYSRQPFEMGRIPGKDEKVDQASPVFESLRDTFGDVMSKSSSGMARAARWAFDRPAYKAAADHCDFASVLPRLRKAATETILKTMQQSDEFGRAVLRYYPFEKLAEIGDKIEEVSAPHNTLIGGSGIADTSKPVVLTTDDKELQGVGISKSDREDIKRFGVAIRDNRSEEDVTKVKRTTVPRSWFTPSCGGVFQLIETNGDISKAYVFDDLITVGEGSARALVVISEQGNGGCVGKKTLLASEELPVEEWNRKFNTLKPLATAGLSRDDKFILVNPAMKATPILTFIGKQRDPEGILTVYVKQTEYIDDCYGTAPCSVGPASLAYDEVDRNGIQMRFDQIRTSFVDKYTTERMENGEQDAPEDYDYERGRRIVVLTDTDNAEMGTAGDSLIIGNDVRVLPVEKNEVASLIAPDVQSLWPQIKQGSQDWRRMVVYSDRGEYQVECGLVKSGRMNFRQTLRNLLCVHGLDKHAAIQVMRDAEAAEAAKDGGAVFAVKYAVSFPDVNSSAGSVAGVSAEQTAEAEQGVDMPEEDAEPFLAQDIQSAVRAAQTGEKEVFDTAVLTSLLRRNDIGPAVQEFLGDLSLGLDRIGRILFLLYAHREAFADEYGEEELPEVIDSLEMLFNELGEVLLFLKTKSGRDQEETGTLGLVTS